MGMKRAIRVEGGLRELKEVEISRPNLID